MKTIAIIVILVAAVLDVAWIVSVLSGQRQRKNMRLTNLVLPLIALLLFVGLFVGESISRNQLKKELRSARENRLDPQRLDEVKAKNDRITFILGKDEEIDELILNLRNE